MLEMMIIGNVGNEPELKFTQGGRAVLNLNVAHNEVWYDKNTNEKRSEAYWVQAAIWGERAEKLAPHIHKGDKIALKGLPKARGYLGRDGGAAATIQLQVRQVELLGTRSNGHGSQQSSHDDDQYALPPGDGSHEDVPF